MGKIRPAGLTSSKPNLAGLVIVLSIMELIGCSSSLNSLTVAVGNRLYPAFHDTVATKLNEKVQIGDSDYSFETTEFYPHFAYIDSTREVVSLSMNPVNPAFKIKVYRDGKTVDRTWAFFGTNAPHFAANSFLTFQVIRFIYRNEVYDANKRWRKDEEDEQ